jgi:hypothetical protein
MRSLLVLILFTLSFRAIGAEASTLFDSDELLKVSIDIKSIPDDRETEVQTTLTEIASGLKLSGVLTGRGNSRLGSCNPSPFKFRRTDQNSTSTLIDDQQTVYAITHCYPSTEGKSYKHETNVTREYLIYRIYALLNPVNIRTRLIKVTYGKEKPHLGMFMESIEDVAANHKMTVSQTPQAGYLNTESWKRLRIFLAFIQDWDKNITDYKNTFLLESADKVTTGVPYDFDFSNFIAFNVPLPTISLDGKYADRMGEIDNGAKTARAVRDSLSQNPDYLNAMMDFKALEPEIVTLINRLSPYLNPEWIKRFHAYTTEFMAPLPTRGQK